MKTTYVACPEHKDCVAELHFVSSDAMRRGGGTVAPAPSWLQERVSAMTFEGMALSSISHGAGRARPAGEVLERRLAEVERGIDALYRTKRELDAVLREFRERTDEQMRATGELTRREMGRTASELASKASEVTDATREANRKTQELSDELRELRLDFDLLHKKIMYVLGRR